MTIIQVCLILMPMQMQMQIQLFDERSPSGMMVVRGDICGKATSLDTLHYITYDTIGCRVVG